MPKTYPLEVRIYAAQRRREKRSWEEVADLVKQTFHLDRAPTRRQMSKWEDEITPNALAQLAVSSVQEKMAAQAPGFVEQHGDFLESVVKAGLRGEDFGKSMVKWMLGQAEGMVGKERVVQAVKEYLAERGPVVEGGKADER